MLFQVLFAFCCLWRFSHQQSTPTPVSSGLPSSLSELPACAQTCFADSQGAADHCSDTDIGCLCSSITFVNALACCLENGCSPADQATALKVDIVLCEQYNISIPDFIGCSPLAFTSASDTSFGTATTTGASHLPSTSPPKAPSAAASITIITRTMAAFETTSGGPTATYSGEALLTGTCTVPLIATYSPPQGSSGDKPAAFPWVGCGAENGDCCPFNPSSAGPLTACPTDYTTTASACCPSGWSIYPSALYGTQTPCYTSLATALAVPSGATHAEDSLANMHLDQLFSLRYELAIAPAALTTGTIIGIALGCIGAIAILSGLGVYFWRQHRLRLHRRRIPKYSTQLTSIPYHSNPTSACPSNAASAHKWSSSSSSSSSATSPYRDSKPFPPTPRPSKVPPLSSKADPGFEPTELHTPAASSSSPVSACVPPQYSAVNELPSPPSASATAVPFWGPQPPSAGLGGAAGAVLTPTELRTPDELPRERVEMPGSTYIHEHHPAFVVAAGVGPSAGLAAAGAELGTAEVEVPSSYAGGGEEGAAMSGARAWEGVGARHLHRKSALAAALRDEENLVREVQGKEWI